MEGLFVLLFVAIFYLIYRALRRDTQTVTREISFHGKSYPFSEIKDDPNFPHVRSIHTKIKGVTYANPDGRRRQKIIQEWCRVGDALYFSREPNNPVDRNAIKVHRVVCADRVDKPQLGEQLGYVSRELAEDLAPDMDRRGFILMGRILNVTGGHDGESFGVNIQVEQYMPVKKGAGALTNDRRKKRRPRRVAEKSSSVRDAVGDSQRHNGGNQL